MSKYDSIKTAAELVKEVRLNGLSLAQEDICRAQDIFGNAPIEELVALANDIGRNNRDGEPDPKGTVSSTRPPPRTPSTPSCSAFGTGRMLPGSGTSTPIQSGRKSWSSGRS